MLPSALECRVEIASRLEGRRPAVFLDYDGTLSPIAPRPEMAAREAALDLVPVLQGRGTRAVPHPSSTRTASIGMGGRYSVGVRKWSGTVPRAARR